MTYKQDNTASEEVQKITSEYITRAAIKTIGIGLTAYGLLNGDSPIITSMGIATYGTGAALSGVLNFNRALENQVKIESLEATVKALAKPNQN